jgi:ornithine cyclodeaminase/alanine dehydrogenase-like protein (mu-crystallin family)
MIILSHDDVADLLPMNQAIEAVEAVMKQVSRGDAPPCPCARSHRWAETTGWG